MLDDARAMIEAQMRPVEGTEQVGLHQADGRVLAADIAAPADLPPFDNSAVDATLWHFCPVGCFCDTIRLHF